MTVKELMELLENCDEEAIIEYIDTRNDLQNSNSLNFVNMTYTKTLVLTQSIKEDEVLKVLINLS